MRELIEKEEARRKLAEAGKGKCREQYMDGDFFKGEGEERLSNCAKYMECNGEGGDYESICEKIARKKAQEGKDQRFGPADILSESGNVSRTLIARTADAMVNNPVASKFIAKIGLGDGDTSQLQQAIEATLVQILKAGGSSVSGGSQAAKMVRDLGRGNLPS